MNMKFTTNQKVKTPIGAGIIQGAFEVRSGEDGVTGVLVRLPIDEQTRPYLRKSNCVTPRAQVSGLWVFQESEVE